MQSNSKKTHQMRSIARYTHKRKRKTKHYKNSSLKKSKKDTYDHQNHLTHPPSSTSKRKTESYDQCKTTEKSTQSPFTINTHYPSSRTSYETLATPTYTQNWISGGGIITYASKKETKAKQRLKHSTDSSNPQSCILDSPTPRQHSKQ